MQLSNCIDFDQIIDKNRKLSSIIFIMTYLSICFDKNRKLSNFFSIFIHILTKITKKFEKNLIIFDSNWYFIFSSTYRLKSKKTLIDILIRISNIDKNLTFYFFSFLSMFWSQCRYNWTKIRKNIDKNVKKKKFNNNNLIWFNLIFLSR